MTRIILIGYMGAGKTTLGRQLAKTLSLPFYDLDWYIETRMRRTVKEIFDRDGEQGFRRIERSMLHEVAEFENVVISCGGGTPCFFDNMEYMNLQGETIYIKESPETLVRHLRMGRGVRPLLIGKTPEELLAFVTAQLAARERYYLQAKHVIQTQVMDCRARIEEQTAGIMAELSLRKNAAGREE